MLALYIAETDKRRITAVNFKKTQLSWSGKNPHNHMKEYIQIFLCISWTRCTKKEKNYILFNNFLFRKKSLKIALITNNLPTIALKKKKLFAQRQFPKLLDSCLIPRKSTNSLVKSCAIGNKSVWNVWQDKKEWYGVDLN